MTLDEETPLVSIRFNALLGPACSVEPMPGCRRWTDGGASNLVTITVTDKAGGESAGLRVFDRSSGAVAPSFPEILLTPSSPLKDGQGNAVSQIGVQCSDVSY